jgi:hypothetical protein
VEAITGGSGESIGIYFLRRRFRAHGVCGQQGAFRCSPAALKQREGSLGSTFRLLDAGDLNLDVRQQSLRQTPPRNDHPIPKIVEQGLKPCKPAIAKAAADGKGATPVL